ncbi:MAG: DUF885 domain-containing protein [Hyphomonadaceae bacterium]
MKRTFTALASILLLAACTPTQEATGAAGTSALAETGETESQRLNDWFELKFTETVGRSPMYQTYLGIKTDYDKWDDASDENALREMDIRRADLAEMQRDFDFDSLDDQAKLSYRLSEYAQAQREASFAYRQHGYTFDQMNGEQSGIPAFMINQHQVTDASDAEAYIARLRGIEAYLDQHIENAKQSAELGIRPPQFVYDYVLKDARNVLTGMPFEGEGDSPLWDDIAGKLMALSEDGTISTSDRTRYEKLAVTALEANVGPAYERLIAFLEAEKAAATTDDGVWKLPDGGAYYQMRLARMTTTDMSASDIHQLGLDEVARIHGEMRVIMQTVGYEGSLEDFMDFMRSDPQFYKPGTDEGKTEYLTEATALIDEMRGELTGVFNTLPQAELTVKAVEAFREQSAGKAFYQRPAPDGSRPGTYYANLYNMADMPTYQMAALAYHEGIPGHHMQLSIAQELEGIPKFRKYGGFTAYTEGWGLYSEFLPKEMGFYADPYSDFGRLAMEIWRAARLVVDTGLHDKQWTREQATQYLMDNTPNPEGDAIKAIDRYIVMPGQATAYKIGMLKILELRARAQAELGDAFTLGDFHDVVLKDGPVPLAILEENVDAWIAEMRG